jgi:hypothetical protein
MRTFFGFAATLTVSAALLLPISASALTYDSDVPSDIQTQMKADLAFINQVTGSGQTKFHQQIFGEMSGAKYQTFFETRIKTVGLDDCGDPNAVACVIPMENPNKMWLTQNFIKFSHPQVARVMVVYHESRHSETAHNNWPHDTCPTPFLDANGKDMKSIWTGASLAGEPACDSTPLGSYGSSTIMLKNIALFCTNCGDKVKMDADLYATDHLGRIDVASVKQAMLKDFANGSSK